MARRAVFRQIPGSQWLGGWKGDRPVAGGLSLLQCMENFCLRHQLRSLTDWTVLHRSPARLILEEPDTLPGAIFATAQTLCPDCKGKKRIELFASIVNCETCRATGYVPAKG